jgi:hypothetical protein
MYPVLRGIALRARLGTEAALAGIQPTHETSIAGVVPTPYFLEINLFIVFLTSGKQWLVKNRMVIARNAGSG